MSKAAGKKRKKSSNGSRTSSSRHSAGPPLAEFLSPKERIALVCKDFVALKTPHVEKILGLHTSSHCYKQMLLSQPLQNEDKLLNPQIWEPFLCEIVLAVAECMPEKQKKSIAHNNKQLFVMIQKSVYDFAQNNGNISVEVCEKRTGSLKGHWVSFMMGHAWNFVSLTKKEMSNGVSGGIEIITTTVEEAFKLPMTELEAKETTIAVTEYKEKIYYIAGYLVDAMGKASHHRKKGVKEALNCIVSNVKLDRDAEEIQNLPSGEVKRIEMFDGLKYVTKEFYEFVVRLEYIFLILLSPEYLTMVGAELIIQLYKALNSQQEFIDSITAFINLNCDIEVESCNVESIVKYISKTYCRLRGKDFVRKMMARDTRTTDQTTRQAQKAVSEIKKIEKMKKAIKKNNTSTPDSNQEKVIPSDESTVAKDTHAISHEVYISTKMLQATIVNLSSEDAWDNDNDEDLFDETNDK